VTPHGRPRSTRALAAALAAGVVALLLVVSPVSADTQAQLDDAKAKVDRLLNQIEQEQNTITDLQNQANALAIQIDKVQTRLTKTQTKVVQLQQQILQATQQMESTQSQLDQRAREQYENGPATGLDFLLGSTSLADLSLRLQVVDNATQDDHDLITILTGQRAELQGHRASLKTLEDSLRKTEADLRDKNDAISNDLQQAQALKVQLEANKQEADNQVTELEKKRAAEIAAERARLEELKKQQEATQRQPQGGGGSWVPGIIKVCPVRGSVAFSDDFGAPRYGGGYHPHAGNDMFAAPNTPIVAPFDGTASDASNPLGGIAVKIYGSQGYVYQAHMSSFGKLGSVHTGDVVGYVGDTGDAPGVFHDHFEWHPNVTPANAWTSPYGYSVIGDAVDPYPYISAVC
jgi:peptidoglycan hydrolase CwlO-like protein